MAADLIRLLTVPPSPEVAEQGLPTTLRDWFAAHIGAPTLAQCHAWPTIFAQKHFLLSAPTGSGKTLAAFLPILSEILTRRTDRLQCLYVAPLKALCRDVGVNLKKAWRSIQQIGLYTDVDLRIGLRTGDTAQRARRLHLRHPPAILLTTPESLSQMLAHGPSHELLRSVRWLVLDEIHALVGNKRGADLAVSVERFDALTGGQLQRIGLSATCAPLATVAEFLVGPDRPCAVAHVGDGAEKRFVIEPLGASRAYSPGWVRTLIDRLDGELMANQTTLIFTNTRNLAERVTWALRRRYPERSDEIAVHHSAISMARRRGVERRLKHGRLWAVVTSTSLELGIDIGTVDQVVFVHPPGGVARLLQRVGRSGHRPDEPRRGLLLTALAGELLEAVVTASSGRDGQIENLRTTAAPFDVLCQQIVGMAMTGAWLLADALALIRRAAPFRDLRNEDFQDCLDYLSGRRRDGTDWLPARLRWQDGRFTIADERTARLLRRNLGTILTEDACAIRLRDPGDEADAPTKALGEVDQAYAERLQPGDRFVLDGRCLELKKRDASALLVEEVFGRPQVRGAWLGGLACTVMPGDLARRIFLFRAQAAEILREDDTALDRWLSQEYDLGDAARMAVVDFLHEQETVSEIPTLCSMLIECVAMQSCAEYFLHTPLPRSANEAIARVLLHRWRGLPKQNTLAVAGDLGIYLVMPGAGPLSAESWRAVLHAERFMDDLRDHLQSSALLAQSFGRVAQTGLMVLRNPLGRKRKVGGKDWTERRLFDQIRAAAPDFVLLRQAEQESLCSACDAATALTFVEHLSSMQIRVRYLAEPSPFGASLLGGDFATTSITGVPAESP